VDDPAANDGLFSAFSGEVLAGQITEFLDLNPRIFQALTDNPAVVEAIARHGSKFDEFLTRYESYRNPVIKEAEMAEETKDIKETTEETAVEGQETFEADHAEAVDLNKEIEKALQLDRKRQADIRELGAKFGFTAAAEKWAADGGSVESFRAHILSKSPEDWRESLAIKNPASQMGEEELNNSWESDAAIAKIKEKRAAKFGVK
jgi:hypothetical protein